LTVAGRRSYVVPPVAAAGVRVRSANAARRRCATLRAVSDGRLTHEECQGIAERTLDSLGDISAADAMSRFDVAKAYVDEIAVDEVSGLPFRRMVFASRLPDGGVMLTVSVDPEPQLVRHARRFKFLANFLEGWRGGRTSGVAVRVMSPDVAPTAPETSG
jgi:hypothetical protein